MNRHIEIEYFCIQRSYKIPYTLLINHTSYISQNTIDLYTFCLGYVGVRNKPHPSRLKLEKQVFWQRHSYLSTDCNSVRPILCSHDRCAFRSWWCLHGYITHGSAVSQMCNNSSLLTLSILNKLSWNVITPCFGQGRQDQWAAKPPSISNNSGRKFQALTSFRPCRLTGTKTLFGPFTFVKACRDFQEGNGGHCDLFNVLICLSSLNWPYYCPSSEANTRKHWPAGPQYWFIRWSPVVVKSLSQHTQDTINSDLSVYVCVCVRTHKCTYVSFPIIQG